MESPQENSKSVQRDFFVDTKGHCFLCLLSSVSSPSSRLEISSFQYISHYLRMCKKAAFNEKVPIPKHLLSKVEKSKLKVLLCQSCGHQVERFSKLYQQLERIQMEVNSCLLAIHSKMVKAGESGKVEEFQRMGERDRMDLEKINIAQRIRKEALIKCVKKLRKAIPQVRLRRYRKPRKVVNGGVTCLPPQPAKYIHEGEVQSGSIKTEEGKRETINMDISRLTTPYPQLDPPQNTELTDYPEISISNLLKAGEMSRNSPGLSPSAFIQPSALGPHSGASFRKILPKPSKPNLLRNLLTPTPTPTTPTTDSFQNQNNPVQLRIIPTKKFKLFKSKRSESKPSSAPRAVTLGPYPCDLCGKVFANNNNLKRHFQSVHLNQRYCCDFCPKSYSQLTHLRMHARKAHFGTQKPVYNFKCGGCHRRYESNWRMDNHLIASPECAHHKVIRLDIPRSEGGVEILRTEESESDQVADPDVDVDPLSGLLDMWEAERMSDQEFVPS